MPIEHSKGGTTITGDSLDFFRLAQLKSAVSLELKGIRLSRRYWAWKVAAKEYNIKGNKQAVYDWLCAKVEELRPQQEHIVDGKRFVGGEEVQ